MHCAHSAQGTILRIVRGEIERFVCPGRIGEGIIVICLNKLLSRSMLCPSSVISFYGSELIARVDINDILVPHLPT